MPHIFFSTTISIFAYFFYIVGFWQISIVCLLMIISYFLLSIQKLKTEDWNWKSISLKKILKQNWLIVARLLILIGIWAFMKFFLIDIIHIFLILIGLNLSLRIFSLLFKYQDWERLFKFTYFLLLLILFCFLYTKLALLEFIPILLSTIIFHLWLFGFLFFIIWNFIKLPKYYFAILYNLTQISIPIALVVTGIYFEKILLSLIISQIFLFFIYYTNFLTFNNIDYYQEKTKKITAEEILQWEKVLQHRKKTKKIKEKLIVLYHQVLKKLNDITLQISSSLNIVFMVLIIILYVKNFLNGINSLNYQIWYRISIIIFVSSFLVIKKTPVKLLNIHKAFVFLIINFVAYINFLYLFGKEEIGNIVSVGILRNFVNAIAISQSKHIFKKWLFVARDYFYRIWANILSLIINIILLIYSWLPWEVIFWGITLYLWAFGFITYYNINYVYELKKL